VPLVELKLPKPARVVCIYRGGQLVIPTGDTVLKEDDEVVVITDRKGLPELQETWALPGNKG